MGHYVFDLREIHQSQASVVGGKGGHLGALSRIEGIHVPPGFCVTTDAFERILAEAPSIGDRLERLARLRPDDADRLRGLSAEIRQALEAVAIPEDLASAITRPLARVSDRAAYAIRSSATAEDLPTASFAGQYDTYLNVVGPTAILEHVRRCWASLFTDRAMSYRMRNGFDHRKVRMAVVVQQMVFPQAAGTLFTADPVTSNRRVASVEASFGLGEALVSGLANGDVYKVRDGEVVAKAVGTKQLAIHASPAGGTQEQAIDPELQDQPALTDAQVVRLAQLGRRIEAHFGRPQDIEWCLVDDGFQIVQSRPITTLFPIPAAGDGENHVYISVGHAQMMTDAMKPLGLSFWQMTTPRPMAEAGGRLFVDVTRALASPASRTSLLEVMGKGDPLIRDALETVLERGDFIRPIPDDGPAWVPPGSGPTPIEADPAIVAELIGRTQASVAALKRDIEALSGAALLDFILADIAELKRILFDPHSHQVFMSAMEATWWLNEQLEAWLGEKNAADTL
ncbi:MAG TPA: PEP/pyruvate-binding domain-containing protein, partial [Thermoanaerobaculia bacterium]